MFTKEFCHGHSRYLVALLDFGLLPRTLRLQGREIHFEMIRAFHNKVFALSIVGFSTLFYLLFGVVNKGETMGTANVRSTCLRATRHSALSERRYFGVGVGLAMERASGWLELKRASPMPPLLYLVVRARYLWCSASSSSMCFVASELV